MTLYFYQATDRTGKIIEGDIDASDYKFAVQKIRSLNYLPIQVSEKPVKRAVSFDFKLPSFRLSKSISPKELVAVTQQLATLVSSGLTIDKSLSILGRLSEKNETREILGEVQRRVQGGSTLAEALAQHPKAFSKLYVNMIRAGEVGGVLGTVLTRLSDFLEKNQDLKNKIRSASIYPLVLFLVGLMAVTVVIVVVIPRFAQIFEGIAELPLPTIIIMTVSDLLRSYWWFLILACIGIYAAFQWYLRQEKGRWQWDTFVLKLPLCGSLIQKIEVSRFSLTMATLLNSGVPILQALQIVQSILNNRVISSAMENLHKGLKGGKGISGPLQKVTVFPPLAIHMITVGEETGNLEEMLTKVSTTYDKEVENAIKGLISLIEPIMVLFMALIIGFIVISILMAIFSINEVPL